MNSSSFDKQSLLTQKQHVFKKTQLPKSQTSKSMIVVVVLFGIAGLSMLVMAGILLFQSAHQQNLQQNPIQIRIAMYNNISIVKGSSRVVQVLYYSGHDDRGKQDFKIVHQRDLIWDVKPSGIINVDPYGRIQALKQGVVVLRVTSKSNPVVYDTKTINVVESNTINEKLIPNKTIINYTGTPQPNVKNLQKIVTRIPKQSVQDYKQIPDSIKKVSLNPQNSQKKIMIKQMNGNIIWQIINYSNNSNNTYIKRVDNTLDDKNRDKIMMFIGNRYLPEEGTNVLSIEDDLNLGLWVVGRNGSVTHISMINLNYEQKAELMVQNTQKYVLRQGIAAGATYDSKNKKWIPGITDNDGLWTSLYAAGELMRYDHLRNLNQNKIKIKKAKQSAFPSLKAVLITDWISGRKGTVQAKIRSYNNSRTYRAQKLTNFYLKKNKTFAIQNYVGSPVDKFAYYGNDANKNVDGAYYGGIFKYSMMPLNQNDWTQTQEPALTNRSLQGFMSRTFGIPQLDGQNRYGGLFFQRFSNGSHKVLSQANVLYDYKATDHPILELGNQPLPQILKSNLLVNGKQYDIYDMVYKGDTSTDQVIGHLFLYKVAYDIMDQKDPQQKQLKNLIRKTMIKFSDYLINNGYQMIDATGQGTSWGKLVRDFLNNDYTTQDAPLKAIQLLLCFKLTYYMTGDEKYEKQYIFLANDPAFQYGKLVSKFWERWVYYAENEDYDPQSNLYRFNFTQNTSKQELLRHHFYIFHYSDDEQGMLAFYLIFQLQQNTTLLEYYKQGMQAYWNHIKKSENPLWYYIYQLAYPQNHQIRDGFGNLILQTATWQLSRHQIDTTNYQAYVQGSRPDVIYQGKVSVNPFKVIGKRTNEGDAQYVNKTQSYQINSNFNPWNIYQIQTLAADQRSIHKFNGVNFQNIHNGNSMVMEPSTTYTLPYWFGIYHKMLKYQD